MNINLKTKVICINECKDKYHIYSKVCGINKIYMMEYFKSYYEKVKIYEFNNYLGIYGRDNFVIYSEYLGNLIKDILE